MISKTITTRVNKNDIYTNITYKLSYDDTSLSYILSIPTNPICEIELLNLNKKDINKVIKKISNIINHKEFSFKTTESIKKLYNWIIVNLNPSQELIL